MTPKQALKAVLKAVAVPPLRVAVDAIGTARMPDGNWFDVPKGFHPWDYMHLWDGSYERAEMQILKDHFKADHTIIEIGANIGVVSCAALKDKLLPQGTIILVEANPISLPCLKANIEGSINGHHVEILPCAVGAPDVEGETQIFQQKMSLGSGLGETVKKLTRETRSIEVPVYSLSRIVNEYAKDGYSLICDAEGAEILILEKDPHSLDTCRQIAIELHKPEQTGLSVTPQHMIKQLESLGFRNRGESSNTYYFDRAPAI